jgi:hypothetical protein
MEEQAANKGLTAEDQIHAPMAMKSEWKPSTTRSARSGGSDVEANLTSFNHCIRTLHGTMLGNRGRGEDGTEFSPFASVLGSAGAERCQAATSPPSPTALGITNSWASTRNTHWSPLLIAYWQNLSDVPCTVSGRIVYGILGSQSAMKNRSVHVADRPLGSRERNHSQLPRSRPAM